MNERDTEKELALLWQRLAEHENEILYLREALHALYRKVGEVTGKNDAPTDEKGGKS